MIKCLVEGLQYAALNINAGEDYNIPLTFTGDDDAALDITGANIFFILKKYQTDSANILRIPVTSFASPETGAAVVPLTHAQTKDLSGSFYYAIEIQMPTTTGQPETCVVVSKGKANFEAVSTSQEPPVTSP